MYFAFWGWGDGWGGRRERGEDQPEPRPAAPGGATFAGWHDVSNATCLIIRLIGFLQHAFSNTAS